MAKWTIYPTQRGERLSTAAKNHLETVIQPMIRERVRNGITDSEKRAIKKAKSLDKRLRQTKKKYAALKKTLGGKRR